LSSGSGFRIFNSLTTCSSTCFSGFPSPPTNSRILAAASAWVRERSSLARSSTPARTGDQGHRAQRGGSPALSAPPPSSGVPSRSPSLASSRLPFDDQQLLGSASPRSPSLASSRLPFDDQQLLGSASPRSPSLASTPLAAAAAGTARLGHGGRRPLLG
jgi:hypothetical protein